MFFLVIDFALLSKFIGNGMSVKEKFWRACATILFLFCFTDQCWSGDTTLYYRNPQSTGCLQSEMNSCDARSTSPCAGNSTSVFVYRL